MGEVQEETIMVEGRTKVQEEVQVRILTLKVEKEVLVEIQLEEVGEVNQEVLAGVPMEEGQVHIVEDQTEKEVIEEILVEIQEVMAEIGQEDR